MYTYNNKCLIKDGKPWFPIMGEIHYSRYSRSLWKESLCKMKAGGVDIASTYVIWIHHEEIENEYNFTGNRDLHYFLECCKDCDIKLLLRIGPWCHGEVRNGGFPDWLLKKGIELRSNDERYFSIVEKWYKVIYEEVKDFLATDKKDNTIIGIQIENEYGHCGGLSDESGDLHMLRLKEIAQNIGFNVPLFTATGWGGARTGGMLPVMGGYCDAPWDPRITKIEASGNFIFTHERNDHNIGSDYGFCHGITFDINKFPYLTAELGGGLQVTKHRRVIARASDIGAMTIVKLGSGVNLLGYYMYHGGTNPDGKLSTLQESKATGSINDLPVKSYDFRAPIGEFGQISDTYRELKLITYFIHDFGNDLCGLDSVIEDNNPLQPDDLISLRYAFRCDGDKGYLFINNYVRQYQTKVHKAIEIKTPSGIKFQQFDIGIGDFCFFPFNISYGNSKIVSALITPLCKIKNNDDDLYIFYSCLKKLTSEYIILANNKEFADNIAVLSKEDARNCWKIQNKFLFITKGLVYENENGEIIYTGREENDILVYPESYKMTEEFHFFEKIDKNIGSKNKSLIFSRYKSNFELPSINNKNIEIIKVDDFNYKLSIQNLIKDYIEGQKRNINNCFLKIKYKGEASGGVH
ncbi:MAG: beta-galactosidase, partial [Treponema sp.]|nr:beta-galactosidase [Treponema sp.]